MYKLLFNVCYYKRNCEQSATQAGVQSNLSCVHMTSYFLNVESFLSTSYKILIIIFICSNTSLVSMINTRNNSSQIVVCYISEFCSNSIRDFITCIRNITTLVSILMPELIILHVIEHITNNP